MLVALFMLGACGSLDESDTGGGNTGGDTGDTGGGDTGGDEYDKYEFVSTGDDIFDEEILSMLKTFKVETTGSTQYCFNASGYSYYSFEYRFLSGNKYTTVQVNRSKGEEEIYYKSIVSGTVTPFDIGETTFNNMSSFQDGDFYSYEITLIKSSVYGEGWGDWENDTLINTSTTLYYKITDDEWIYGRVNDYNDAYSLGNANIYTYTKM